jgi:hypothetical protein
MTFALIQINPLALVQQYGALPSLISVPSLGQVAAPPSGWTNGTYSLVPVVLAGSPTSQFSVLTGTTLSFDGTNLTITSVYSNPALTKPQLLAYTAQKKAVKLQSGTSLGGNTIPTDLQTQIILVAAYVAAVANASFTLQWNLSGAPVQLNATQIKAAMAQVGTFFSSIQTIEATTITGINGGTVTTLAQIDTAFA